LSCLCCARQLGIHACAARQAQLSHPFPIPLLKLPVVDRYRVTRHAQRTHSGTRPLHQTDAFKVTVLYRDGQEVVDQGNVKANARASKVQARGLRDWGVFGPILSTVFLDAARSNLSWSRWEQGATGAQAVFRYAVPMANSHYRVNYCCVPGYEPGSDAMYLSTESQLITGRSPSIRVKDQYFG
jgi:hypothetical protein